MRGARKTWIKRDLIARKSFCRIELNKIVLKSLLSTESAPWAYKFYWVKLYHSYSRKNCLAFYRRGCHWTNSGRSVFKLFKFSRHWCKHLSSMGHITGMRKSSF